MFDRTPHRIRRRRILGGALLPLAGGLPQAATAQAGAAPIVLAIDGEFGLLDSTSAQAVELGVRTAVTQINAAGGLLGGRPLVVITRDHRSIAARGIDNIRSLAAMPEVVAVFGCRFSPVVIEQLPILRQARLPFLAVWSAATAIVDNGSNPNYVFRLSLRDDLAMPFMLRNAYERGFARVGLLLTNTAWGRSNLDAAQDHAAGKNPPAIAGTAWYNWQEKTLLPAYARLLSAGAQAIVLVANDDEAALLVREVATLAPDKRRPIISHWGITGGKFVQAAGPALRAVDFSVIQTFSFFNAARRPLQAFMETVGTLAPIRRIDDIVSPVGVAHAYDMTHILAKAIQLAGSTQRPAVRDALERVPAHDGLVRRYAPPFTPTRHEALGPQELLMARFREDGVVVPARTRKPV